MVKEKILYKLNSIARVLFLTLLIFGITSFGNKVLGDNLNAVAATGTGISNSSTYTEVVTSGSINVDNIDKILVYATFTTQSTQSDNVKRTLTLRIRDELATPNTSNEIMRHLVGTSTGDKGIGSLFYIFDVSSLSGDKTYTLEHYVDGNKNTETVATIVALSLNTDATPDVLLNNDMKAITTGVNTTSTDFVPVTGLTTDIVALPVFGGMMISASINCQKNGQGSNDDKGEWGLQMQKDGGGFSSIGNSIQRTMASQTDIGIITLIAFLDNQPAGDYNFQVVHKVAGGSTEIQTLNTTLVAMALGYLNNNNVGRRFAINKTTVSSIETTSTTATPASSLSSITAQGTSVLLLGQFGTQAVISCTPSFSVTSNGGTVSSNILQRYLSSGNARGAGGFTGLVSGLTESSSYNFNFNHYLLGGGTTITTTNIIFGAVQLTDSGSPGFWTGTTSTAWNNTANWADGVIPTSTTDVTIYDKDNDPVISSSADCKNLEIVSGSVTIAPDYSLTVAEEIINTANDGLVIQSTSDGDGSLIYTTGTPNANVERYVDVNAWHLVTPITIPSTANDFYTGAASQSWLANHTAGTGNAQGTGYTYITENTTTLNRGQGYSYWIKDTVTTGPQTIEFTGTLIGTDFPVTLGATSTWNLLGNPFSSAIDWTSVDAGNTTGTAYVWKNGIDGYVYSSGSGQYTLLDNIIPLGQGFFVEASASGIFTIPASERVHNTASFIKSENSDGSDPTQFVRIDLDNGYYGNTVFVGFPENGTDDFDISGDATKLYSSAENIQFFAVENDNELCINANAPLIEGESKAIPLNLVQVTDGSYTMAFSDLDQLENTTINLEDNITGIVQDIRANPVYTFTASSSDDSQRFLLHFAWSPNDIGEDIEQASNIQIYSYGNEVYIRSTNEAVNQNGIVIVYDIMGRKLAQQSITGTELIKIPVNTTNNLVVVKVIKDNTTKIQKVFIK